MIRRSWLVLLLVIATVPAAAQRYVAVGDSITFGFADESLRPEKGYPSRLEELLIARGRSADVTNAGINGETSAEALSRINSVLAGGYNDLLLMEGTNDIGQRLSPETIRFNLEQIGLRAAQQNVRVTLGTVVPRLPSANFDGRNRVTRRLAQEVRNLAHGQNWGLADPFEVFITTPNVFTRLYAGNGDNLHPNAAGYDNLALVFADVLTGIDSLTPVTGRISPADASENVPTDAEVSVEVFDFGAGIDLTATSLLVNDEVVTATATGDSKRLVLTYRPTGGFRGAPAIRLRTRDTATVVHPFDAVVTQFIVAGAVFLPGDLTRNGRVDGEDLINLALRFGASVGDDRYRSAADLNGDGTIDGGDLAILAGNFGKIS
ncbi:MAG: GDSL-type esterase/lipase family protein [Thermoanaerobaculia bacterium]|nr:GDSL-type esterase/lipase family protein [Thermoanaerobaculia bacterium]